MLVFFRDASSLIFWMYFLHSTDVLSRRINWATRGPLKITMSSCFGCIKHGEVSLIPVKLAVFVFVYVLAPNLRRFKLTKKILVELTKLLKKNHLVAQGVSVKKASTLPSSHSADPIGGNRLTAAETIVGGNSNSLQRLDNFNTTGGGDTGTRCNPFNQEDTSIYSTVSPNLLSVSKEWGEKNYNYLLNLHKCGQT